MADRIKDGGPAYPVVFRMMTPQGMVGMEVAPGMSLRDALAMHAPVTWADVHEHIGWRGDKGPLTDSGRATLWAVMARLRYEYADAMLEARKENGNG